MLKNECLCSPNYVPYLLHHLLNSYVKSGTSSVFEAKRWIKPNLCLQWDYILVQKELNSSLILYLEDTVGTQKKSNQPKIGASGDDA